MSPAAAADMDNHHQPDEGELPTLTTDVLIAGSGSAGLCAALWLARYGVPFRILERRDGPLRVGQADGVQCRTVEIFESFGLADAVLREAYHVLEVAFWAEEEEGGTVDGEVTAPPPMQQQQQQQDGVGEVPSQKKDGEGRRQPGIRRTHFAADTLPGLSHMPHIILNQARINAIMLEEVERIVRARGEDPAKLVEYGCEVKSVRIDGDVADPDAYPVAVMAVRDGVEREYRAKYVLGCDGAHSAIRKSLGIRMIGDSSDAVWGVMDMYPRTDFPDIRKKAVIHSASGSLLIVPREGDALVRFYIEQPPGTPPASVTLAALQEQARRVFAPSFDLGPAGDGTDNNGSVAWWSAYSIGQRLAERFHAGPHRVFLTGDACHTHSPKAGQGMNVSLQDGYNVGWKLGAVLTGAAQPALLETYVSEREVTAADLIEFDLHFTRLFSSRHRRENGISPAYFQEQFVRAGQYTAGLATRYAQSLIVRPSLPFLPRPSSPADGDKQLHDSEQQTQQTDSSPTTSTRCSTPAAAADAPRVVAAGKVPPPRGLVVGMRFPSAQVVRFSDAKAVQLVRALASDGRWRFVVFAGDILEPAAAARLDRAAKKLAAVAEEFTPPGADPDSAIEALLVVICRRTLLSQERIPDFFWPATGRWKIRNLHRVFVDDESYNSGHGHAYRAYGVDPRAGALVVVRPDQYIASVSSLDSVDGIGEFFRGFMIPQREAAAGKR